MSGDISLESSGIISQKVVWTHNEAAAHSPRLPQFNLNSLSSNAVSVVTANAVSEKHKTAGKVIIYIFLLFCAEVISAIKEAGAGNNVPSSVISSSVVIGRRHSCDQDFLERPRNHPSLLHFLLQHRPPLLQSRGARVRALDPLRPAGHPSSGTSVHQLAALRATGGNALGCSLTVR